MGWTLGKDQTLEDFENPTEQFEREREEGGGESVCVEKIPEVYFLGA